MIESFYIRSSSKNNSIVEECNIFLLALFGLINASSNFVLDNNGTYKGDFNENIYIQRKWLETIVDFALNVNENKNARESDYKTSTDFLKFLFKIYNNTDLINFFLVSILPISRIIKISEYLNKYIDDKIIEIINNFNNYQINNFDFVSITVFIQNVIKFSKNENSGSKINKNGLVFIQNLFKFYQSNNDIITMKSITECLYVLYENDSIYYDNQNLLESCLNNLSLKLKNKIYPFDDLSRETNEHMIAMMCILNLTCLSYKANLVKKEFIISIYEYLKSVLFAIIIRTFS